MIVYDQNPKSNVAVYPPSLFEPSLFEKCRQSMLQYLYDHGPIVHTGAAVLPPRSLEARVVADLIDAGWVKIELYPPTRGPIKKEIISLH